MVQMTCVKDDMSNVVANISATQQPNKQHCSHPKSHNAKSHRQLKIITNLPMKHPVFVRQLAQCKPNSSFDHVELPAGVHQVQKEV